MLVFAHLDLAPYARFDARWVLDSVGRKHLHEVRETDCMKTVSKCHDVVECGRTFGRVWGDKTHPNPIPFILKLGLSPLLPYLLLLLLCQLQWLKGGLVLVSRCGHGNRMLDVESYG